jgi:chromosomal replication initiation ATPase DnaA
MHIESQTAPSARLPVLAEQQAYAFQDVIGLVSRHTKVPSSAVLGASRDTRPIARARQLAMYLAHVMLGESLTAVGMAFGRDRTTVSYACGLIEDLRDDPHFDAEVSALEQQLQRDEG